MTKYFKEMRQLRKLKLQLEVALIGKIYNLSEELSKIKDEKITSTDAINALKSANKENKSESLDSIINQFQNINK